MTSIQALREELASAQLTVETLRAQIAAAEAKERDEAIAWGPEATSSLLQHGRRANGQWVLRSSDGAEIERTNGYYTDARILALAALIPPTAEARVTDAVVDKAWRVWRETRRHDEREKLHAALTAVLPDLVAGLRPTGGQRVWRHRNRVAWWTDTPPEDFPIEFGTVYPDAPEGTP